MCQLSAHYDTNSETVICVSGKTCSTVDDTLDSLIIFKTRFHITTRDLYQGTRFILL